MQNKTNNIYLDIYKDPEKKSKDYHVYSSFFLFNIWYSKSNQTLSLIYRNISYG